MKSWACARRAAASICSWRRVRPRVGDVPRDGVGEEEAVVGDEGDLVAQRGEVDLADVGAVDQHAALARVVQPRQQPDQAGLARGGRPDQGDGPPGLHLEVDPGQRGLAPVVAQGHALHRDPAAAGGQRRGAGRAGHLGLAVEDLEHPVAGGDRALGHAQRHAEPADRAGEQQQVDVEGGEVAEAEAAVDHLVAADQQHDRQPDVREEAHQRRVEGLQLGRDHALLEDPVDRAAEAVHHVPLARERLHDPDPGDALLGAGGQLADPLLDLLLGGPVAPAVAGRGRDQERERAPAPAGRAADRGMNITVAAKRIVSALWLTQISP